MKDLVAAMLTPAVMINVCGLLLLSTANRNSRIIDRIRMLNSQLLNGELSREAMDNYNNQLLLFKKRAKIIKNSLILNYSALLMFILTSLTIYLAVHGFLSETFVLLFLLSGFFILALYAGFLIWEGSIHFETTALDIELAKTMLKKKTGGKKS